MSAGQRVDEYEAIERAHALRSGQLAYRNVEEVSFEVTAHQSYIGKVSNWP